MSQAVALHLADPLIGVSGEDADANLSVPIGRCDERVVLRYGKGSDNATEMTEEQMECRWVGCANTATVYVAKLVRNNHVAPVAGECSRADLLRSLASKKSSPSALGVPLTRIKWIVAFYHCPASS